jgi:transposase-like protein
MGPWGTNAGSVYLGDQKVRVTVPRVRRKDTGEEVPLLDYVRLQQPGVIEEMALKRALCGVSQGNYRGAALCVPETFGIGRGGVSKRWIRASARRLKEFTERRLEGYDIVALILDGKWFGENAMIVAMGVTITGAKVLLGFIESSTENGGVCRDFLNGLLERGLRTDQEILVVMDGGKGLKKGVDEVLGDRAIPARCQWHKRENVVSYLNPGAREEWRRRLREAQETPGYEEAKRLLTGMARELRIRNESAANSLVEGMEETLTLQRLGLFRELGTSFKTTNLLENVNRLLEDQTGRVCRWRTSDQRRRWVGTAMLKIEPRLRRIKGHQHLPMLREAMCLLRRGQTEDVQMAA